MDLSSPSPTTSSPLIPVFGDNVQDLLGRSALNVNPSAIITVNSIADAVDDLNSGVITLRDAINQANADNREDLIVFDRSVFSNQQTITLSGTELDITHNLDIIAPRDPLTGGDLLTVSGNKASRVFEIGSGATVTLSGLIVADGNAQNGKGGGILNGGILTLDSSIVSNNSAGFGFGGGIFGGNLVVNNSTISGNSANYGGGIAGSGVVSNSTINGNWALNFGGGIFNGIFNGNSDDYKGGTLTVSNSIISGNSLIGGKQSSGGGIFNGNIGLTPDTKNITLTVSNSTISGNSVTGFRSSNGGGIYNNGNLAVSNSIISNNSGSGSDMFYIGSNGSGIYNSGTVEMSNSTISGNSATNGGGFYNGGTVNMSSSTISGNSAYYGGGFYNSGTSAISTVSNSTLSGNSTDGKGGGIFNGSGTVTLVFSTLTGNQAANVGGGVFNNSPYASTNARNTIIAANLNSTNGINPDVSGTYTSIGYNLIGDGTGSTGFDATGDIVGNSDNPIDPRLAPLDFYGGSTQTLALLPDSPAIDAGDPTILDTDPTTDQRGLPRVVNGRADIGAFEFS